MVECRRFAVGILMIYVILKSMTLDDLERPFRTLFQNTRDFRVHYENLNEDRPTLSAAAM